MTAFEEDIKLYLALLQSYAVNGCYIIPLSLEKDAESSGEPTYTELVRTHCYDTGRRAGRREGGVITVRYPDGRIEQRTFAIISGENPIGSARPIPDGATLEIMDGCITVTAAEGAGEQGTIAWPWYKITELNLGPVVLEQVILREDGTEEDIPF